MIEIIDYQAGNSLSVQNALKKIGRESRIVKSPDTLNKAKIIILPGVGSAVSTMDNLKENGFLEALQQFVIKEKTPFIGICIGYQIIFNSSEEGKEEQESDIKTLGWLEGKVRKINSEKVKVPQMGWNEVRFNKNAEPFLSGLSEMEFFYFVNSYYALPEKTQEEKYLLAETTYGDRIGSMVRKDNIVATQFHLEKSGAVGLRLFENIIDYFLN